MNGLIVGTQGSCVRYGTMVRKGGKTLPVVSENIADLFQKRCPCFKKTMGNVFQFYGQRISVPPATNFDALGNEFGASVLHKIVYILCSTDRLMHEMTGGVDNVRGSSLSAKTNK